jgi:hypothetical protein
MKECDKYRTGIDSSDVLNDKSFIKMVSGCGVLKLSPNRLIVVVEAEKGLKFRILKGSS